MPDSEGPANQPIQPIQQVRKKPPGKLWKRILAGCMAFLLIASMAMSWAVQIRFEQMEYLGTVLEHAAAVTEENTEYLSESSLKRAWNILRYAVGKPKSFDDYEMYASLAIARKEYGEAIQYMQGCIDLYSGESQNALGVLYLRLGSLYALTEDSQSAITSFDKALELVPGLADAYLLRAQMYAILDDMDQAVADIRHYEELAGDDPAIRASIGTLYESAGEYENAVACYTVGIEQATSVDPELLASRARCYLLLGKTAEAKKDLDRFFAEGGTDPTGERNAMLGTCCMEAEEYERATTVFTSNVTFGGFFAVAVVLENVKAALRGTGSLIASKGNVSILSNSEQVVITKADASLDPAAAPKSQTMGQVLNIVSTVVGTAKKFLLGESGPVGIIKNKIVGFFSSVDDNISGGSYNLTVEPTTNGTVTAPQKGKGDGTTLINEDDSFGLATAMGADMERILSKFRTGTDKVEENTNKVTQGTWTGEDLKSNNNQNQTAGKVNEKLTENANDNGTGGEGAQTSTSNNLPTSTNALRSQNAGTGTTPDTTKTQDAVDKANPTGQEGATTNVNTTMPQAQSIQVAAAVALNITNHKAVNTISGNVTAGTVSILADNNGNFRTRGSGATMTMGSALAAIAAAVAVSVNNNQAVSNVSGSIVTDADHIGTAGNTIDTEDAGNVTIEAHLTQNMDNEYRGALGAQAVAGSVTGVGSKATISGAIAVLVSKAVTEATFNMKGLEGKSISAAKDITLSATDKSKLAVRAGAVSISSGTAIGVGASIATIYGQNNVISAVGSNSTIAGKSLAVEAKKLRVDMSDFDLAPGITTLISNSSVSNGSPSSSAGNKGILDLNKDSASESYSVSINITSENILDAIDLMNFLASTNYYVEAIAGSVISPADATSTASVAGSIAMAYFTNLVKAMIGDNCDIDMSGDVVVNAETDTNARLIGGALSVSPSKAGVGLNAATIANNDMT